MTFICYPKCTTCQKAQKWLDENGVSQPAVLSALLVIQLFGI